MDTDLKQRIIGAAVLFGLAVIFVPMILDGPVDRPSGPQSTGVPLELPDPQAAETETEPAREPADRPEPVPTADPTPVPSTRDQPRTDGEAGWAVQLGSFSADGNADALATRMREAGFEAFVQRVEVSNGTMYRVRVGPVADREEAEALAVRVRERSGEPAVVVEHP